MVIYNKKEFIVSANSFQQPKKKKTNKNKTLILSLPPSLRKELIKKKKDKWVGGG